MTIETTTETNVSGATAEVLTARFCEVRDLTERLAAPLSGEDQTVQSMPDVSPTKWHRAHTAWFFEEFILQPHAPGDTVFHPEYQYLFNSYYEAVGARYPRAQRGFISRPGAAEIAEYRRDVDRRMTGLLGTRPTTTVGELTELGLHHEQQHQELLLMDIKHVLSCNTLDPAYHVPAVVRLDDAAAPVSWLEHPGGVGTIGHDGDGFGFDNEFPRHETFLQPFALATRGVTNGEWLEFMADGGYQRPELWLSDGWAAVNANRWDAPLYWRQEDDGEWTVFTLAGRQLVNPHEPVCHISYYEADAFAHWTGFRLPTEFEWETIAIQESAAHAPGNLLDIEVLHPRPASSTRSNLLGDVWQWTSSAYQPYPGFRAAPGAVGEYNGKFMVNQHVLRGGSCVTPIGHTRPTYRNFFPPHARWAFSGMRLARDT